MSSLTRDALAAQAPAPAQSVSMEQVPVIQADPAIQGLQTAIKSCYTMDQINRVLKSWGWENLTGAAQIQPTRDAVRRVIISERFADEKTLAKKLQKFGIVKSISSTGKTPLCAAAPRPVAAAAAAAAPRRRLVIEPPRHLVAAAAAAATAAAPRPVVAAAAAMPADKYIKDTKKATYIINCCQYREDAERAIEFANLGRILASSDELRGILEAKPNRPELSQEQRQLSLTQQQKLKKLIIDSSAHTLLLQYSQQQKKFDSIIKSCDFRDDVEKAAEVAELQQIAVINNDIIQQLPNRFTQPLPQELASLTKAERKQFILKEVHSVLNQARIPFKQEPKFIKLPRPPKPSDTETKYAKEQFTQDVESYNKKMQKILAKSTDDRYLQLQPHEEDDEDKPKCAEKAINKDVRHGIPDPYDVSPAHDDTRLIKRGPEAWSSIIIRNRICDTLFISAAGIGSHLKHIQENDLPRADYKEATDSTQKFHYTKDTDYPDATRNSKLTRDSRIQIDNTTLATENIKERLKEALTRVSEAVVLEISRLLEPPDEKLPKELQNAMSRIKEACKKEIRENNFVLAFPSIDITLNFKEILERAEAAKAAERP